MGQKIIDYELVVGILQNGIKSYKKEIELQNERIGQLELDLKGEILKSSDEMKVFALKKCNEILKIVSENFKRRWHPITTKKEIIEGKDNIELSLKELE